MKKRNKKNDATNEIKQDVADVKDINSEMTEAGEIEEAAEDEINTQEESTETDVNTEENLTGADVNTEENLIGADVNTEENLTGADEKASDGVQLDKIESPENIKLEKMSDDMTEITEEDSDRTYTDEELEAMDEARMAHHIMNDENRTDMDLLSSVFEDDAFNRKQKKKEAKAAARREKKKRKQAGSTKGIRFLGIMAVIMAVAGVGLVLVTIYYLAIAPTYNKNSYLNDNYEFADSASLTDADYTVVKEGYYVPELATGEDALLENVTTEEAAPDEEAFEDNGGELNE